MRKLVGFVFFVISVVLIAAIIVANVAIFSDFLSNIEEDGFLLAAGIFIGYLWETLYQPIVVLLLSVLAMGNYSK